jgi:hypothetical protein
MSFFCRVAAPSNMTLKFVPAAMQPPQDSPTCHSFCVLCSQVGATLACLTWCYVHSSLKKLEGNLCRLTLPA